MKNDSVIFYLGDIIAIPENNASNPAHQSVKSCVRYICCASARRTSEGIAVFCNFLGFSSDTTLYRIHRTGFAASAAADAFRAVWFFHRVNLHLAGFCTFSTLDALVMINSVAEYGYSIENRVKSP